MSDETERKWMHIDTLMKAGGQITLGRVAPLDGVALAGNGKDLYAALRRRPDESIEALLQRLDQAIDVAQRSGTHINEINNGRYVLKAPSTRKRR
ncbi:MAG: hypothetical protein JSR66_34040 [Proteobacteria bacterium]|nr:hypothetical protein [Pseudomonadota bacterium]